jgi:CheY-like chemotaxis protein/HPt (histidine-containing phosphotransfer) domain-containing protein
MLDFGTHRDLFTILLIDDDLISREVLATVLTMGGFTVHTAEDGAASLDILTTKKCTPDVILMDAQMPGLNGPQLIAELRASSNALVIAISGTHAPRDLVDIADGFLLKPFGAAALQELLKKHVATGDSAALASATMRPGNSSPQGSYADEPVISPETLGQFREMMSESAVHEIYSAVVADLAKRLAMLETAVAAGDATQIHSIGHAIKGGCGMAGALQAARLGALLEAIPLETKGNYLDNSTELLADLRDALHNLERMLKAEFQS